MRQRGFTLVELMVVLAVAMVLLAVSVPSFFSTTARARLEGAVNELAIDLQYARSEAVRERAAVTLAVSANGGGYTITNATATIKTVSLPRGVALSPSATVAYDALRGMAAATSIDGTVSGLSGAVRVSTNALGRVLVCSPSGAVGGYPTC